MILARGKGSVVCTILCYHEIAPLQPGMRESLVVSPKRFRRHLAYLRLCGFQSARLEDIAAHLAGDGYLPRRSVAITFDDGYRGVIQRALPALLRFGFGATLFLPSGLIGQDKSRGDEPPTATMDASQVREWLDAGMAIGGHTRTHADLALASADDLRAEVKGSRTDLEEMFGRPVEAFAYPYGRYTSAAVEVVRDSGYHVACSTQFGRVKRDSDPHALPRVMVGNDLGLPWFLYRVWRSSSVTAAQPPVPVKGAVGAMEQHPMDEPVRS